jgi:hypothetical protein
MAGLKKGDAKKNDSREEWEEACIIRENTFYQDIRWSNTW